MKKYPTYKPSGVDWLGDIPSDWVVSKVKFVSYNLDGNRIPLNQTERLKMQGEYPYYGATGIIDYIDNFLIDGEFILVGEDGAPFTIPNRDVAFEAKGKIWVNNHAHIIKGKKKYHQTFLTHSLNIVDYSKYVQGSTREKLTQSDLSNIPLLDIALPEQQSIVHFLDYKTLQIDSFIANRQKQMQLLKEQLHFKINEAITKGIKSKVKFKPTDIKYVPEIPEHWDIRKFKSLTSILTCGVAATPEYVEESEGIAFLSAQNCRPFAMDLSKYSYIKPSLHKQLTRYKKPQRGDVLVTRVGAGIGQACIIDTDLEFSVYVSLTHIRPNKEILSEYIVCFFNTEYCYQLNHEGTVVGGGQGNLNVKNVERYRIPLPPIEEQKEIIEYLDNYRTETDNLISKYQKQIELMQEYRTSLISQAVTGKIDVREWQPKKKGEAS